MRTNLSENLNGASSNIAWNYDRAYRLLSETRTGTLAQTNSYTYDNNGNRQSWTSSIGGTVTYSYNANDQIITTTAGSTVTNYQYDGRGNLKQSGTSSYTYNAADLLITVVVNGNTANYQYDQDGRRVQQSVGSNVTNYAWDETSAYGDVLLETNGSGAAQTTYVLGGSELLSQNKIGGTGISYFLHDGQGSTRALVDGSGNVRSSELYTYDAFGNLISGQTNLATSYLYTGQQFDAPTSLYSLRARYYNPNDGRFVSRDINNIDSNNPIELNRYVYTSNNSINKIDPNGRELEEYGALNQNSNQEKSATAELGEETVADADAVVELKIEAQQTKQILRESIKEVSPNNPQAPLTFLRAKFVNASGAEEEAATINTFYGEANSSEYGFNGRLEQISDKAFDSGSYGRNIRGGVRAGSDEADAKHAEELLRDFVQESNGLGKIKPNSTIRATISRSKICQVCQELGTPVPGYSPSGVLKIVVDDIRIIIVGAD